MAFSFWVQLYDILTQFLFMAFLSGCSAGKWWSMSARKRFPIFVCTVLLYGGLNQMMCLFLFFLFLLSVWLSVRVFLAFSVWLFVWSCFVYVNVCVWPLFLNACWYAGAASSNACLLLEMLLSLVLIDLGISLMMLCGWFEST